MTWLREKSDGPGWAGLGKRVDGDYVVAWDVVMGRRPESPADIPEEWLIFPALDVGAVIHAKFSDAMEEYDLI